MYVNVTVYTGGDGSKNLKNVIVMSSNFSSLYLCL